VLYLTAKDDVASKVKGLKLGAEDYMVKPFEMLELLVRIEKVLERTGRARKVLTIRNIMVDVQSHQVLKDGIPVNLKPMEYDLFVLLLQNKNIALGREELLKRVWGEDYLGECDTFAGGKKSAHSVGLLNNNQSVNW
jgi:Response regulators consisting of a CheY-like receiver domain and a winged-helix DNA-binding domain